MAHLTKDERERFLAETHVGVLSVSAGDGRPPSTAPTWYGYEPSGHLTFFTNSQGHVARKTDLIRQAGVVSFCVQHEEPPYRYVTIEGTVVGDDQPPTAEQMLAIVRRYLPDDMAQQFVEAELDHPDSRLVVFTIRPDRWLTADFSEE